MRQAKLRFGLAWRELLILGLFLSPLFCGEVLGIFELLRGDWIGFVVVTIYVVFFSFFVVGMFNLTRASRRKSEIEVGRKSYYSELGGGTIGFNRATWPFVRFSIYEDLLVVKYGEEIALTPKDIWNVKMVRGFTATGIEVQHLRKDVPRPIILWTSHPKEVEKRIVEGLHLREMPQYGHEPMIEGVSEQERKERRKYPWLQ